MDTDLSDLLALLDLTSLDDDLFQGESRNIVGPRIFGGQVIAQGNRFAIRVLEIMGAGSSEPAVERRAQPITVTPAPTAETA